MKNEINDHLIARYVTGECSDEEEEKVRYWMNDNPGQKKVIENLRKKWDLKKTRSYNFDTEAALKRVTKGMTAKDNVPVIHSLHESEARQTGKSGNNFSQIMKSLLRVAAAVLVIGFTVLYFFQYGDGGQQFAMQDVITERGQRANIQLNDGSRISLSADSKLSYPDEFGTDSRTVTLAGEAYFKVVSDERPFLVYTDDAVIRILGTEFNVQSYEDEQIRIVVADGRVAVRSASADEDESAVLERGDMAQLNRNGNGEFIISHDVDLHRYLGWLDYRLQFDDTPLERVIKELERWYDVDIHLSDPSLSGLRFTSDFENEQLPEILTVLKYTLQLEYEIDNRKIILYPQ